MHIKTPLAVAITLTLAMGAAAPLQAAGQQAVAATGAVAADAVDLDRIEVRAQLESQIRAVDLKRSSNAIEDAVSSDALGQYPDKNVAESLQRLPGISVTRDQGEGRYVVVRGLDANLNSVSVDGIAIGTPDNSSRAAPMDVIPSDSTERLRVVKSPTPDMPGDAIGGAILVETASAFDREGRSLRGKIEGSHQQLSGETSPKAAFNYSEVFNDTFGIAAGVNYQKRTFESDNSEVEYGDVSGNKDPTTTRPGEITALNLQNRKYEIERKRIGANLNFDWRPNEDSRYYLRTLYSQFDDAETRQRVIFNFNSADMIATGTDQYRLAGMPKDSIDKRMRYRTKEENTFAASLGGENKLTDAVLDYKIGYTRTEERVDDEIESRFKLNGKAFNGTLDQRSRLPTYTFDNDQWLDNANYKFDRVVAKPKRVDDEERSAQVNIRFDGDNSSYKFGLLGRWRDRDVNVDEASLRVGPAIKLSDWTTGSPEHRHGPMGQGMDSSAMRSYWSQHGGEYSARPQDVGGNAATSLEGDYTAREDVFASYAMGTWDIGALRVIGGVRVENTRFSATGNRVDVAKDGRSYTATRVTASKNYNNVLPGLHLRYDASDDWVFRFAANKTVARPGFGDASPRIGLARNDNEVRLGNPELDPYESTNIDLSVEKYIGDSGILSLGVFHKLIDGYIVQVRQAGADGIYDGLPVVTSVNGDKAKVRGAEFNWQQQLSFLPAGWDGLLVGASGTWLDTDFDPGLAKRAGEDFTLPRASKNVYSAHIGYEKYGLSTRVAAVHRSEYLDTLGAGRAFDIYVAPNTQLDFSLDYRFTPRVSMYFEAQNLLDKPLELYQGTRSRTLQMEEYGRTYALGLKVAL
ncbi:TonB-dependent receptor [Stenotrophomonas maltophilia]|nr:MULTISPECIES: TonB-dependent receptor [Stenotrophomonas]EMB2831860.1 TonB-dependent receptor [Stenotrophomonas maltophilia]EMB2834031.1 TonB-dependent receptor [Stenotrophomonas maltophilia]MBH1453313.1 TonB-dependent receptor [Stenotrophomonas maltophilia]MBK5593644.1 TonB-dependent receptor [Stenotrophomonas maltophilia]MBN5189717.1 TonB-dependent receptor [Stenotrophomonas maltophilia]